MERWEGTAGDWNGSASYWRRKGRLLDQLAFRRSISRFKSPQLLLSEGTPGQDSGGYSRHADSGNSHPALQSGRSPDQARDAARLLQETSAIAGTVRSRKGAGP